jgi:hypothetical protein
MAIMIHAQIGIASNYSAFLVSLQIIFLHC